MLWEVERDHIYLGCGTYSWYIYLCASQKVNGKGVKIRGSKFFWASESEDWIRSLMNQRILFFNISFNFFCQNHVCSLDEHLNNRAKVRCCQGSTLEDTDARAPYGLEFVRAYIGPHLGCWSNKTWRRNKEYLLTVSKSNCWSNQMPWC